MGTNSGIQWTDHTWNVAVGCTKVDEDCKYCYMYRDGEKFGYDAKIVRKTKTVFNLPLRIKEPSKIFTSSLTDFFHPDIDSFRYEAWEIIRQCPQHIFQILTKRPERIAQCLPIDWEYGYNYPNVWLGTSVGSQESIGRMYQLASHINIARCNVLFVSIEPMHTEVIIDWKKECSGYYFHEAIDWIIVGGESGNETGKYRYRPCKTEWIKKIVDDCNILGIPVFVKQLGTYLAKELKMSDRHGGNIDEFPEYLQVRKFPDTPQSRK